MPVAPALGIVNRYRLQIDALYRAVKDEDAYSRAQLTAQLADFDAKLRVSPR